jgi:cytochrome c-type biogenesis protein CcmH
MTLFLTLGALLALLSLALLTRPLWPESKGLLLSLAGLVSALAVAGYAWVGTPRALDREPTASAAGTGQEVTLEQVEAMVGQIEARLKDKPQNAEAWAMLGRAQAVLGRHEQAAQAFKQAVALRGDDPMLLAHYADALAGANGRSLEGEPSRLLDKALAIDPGNLKALSLAGTRAFNRQDYPLAVQHWENLVRLAPDPAIAQQVQQAIDEARRRAGLASAAPAASSVAAGPLPQAGASLSGTVSLAPTLAARTKPGDTLFVFARAADGPRMPLAIVRKQVKDLPLNFTLDDSMAMTPAAKLSSATRVVVGARISARGDATPQPGDLQGFSMPVAPGAAGLKIEIAEVVATP